MARVTLKSRDTRVEIFFQIDL